MNRRGREAVWFERSGRGRWLRRRRETPVGVGQRTVWYDFLQESFNGDGQNPIHYHLLASSVEKNRPAFGIVLSECLEPGEVAGFDFCGVFYLDGDKLPWRVDDEINLYAGTRPPEVERVALAGVVEPCAKMLEDESFEGHAVDFLRPVQRTFGSKCAIDSGVEEIELAVSNQFALCAFCEDWYLCGDEHFLEDLEIGVHRGALDSGFAGDFACGEHRAVGEGRRFEKTREDVKISDYALVDDLFLKVEVEICPEHILRLLCNGIADKRKHSELKRFGEVEVRSHLRGKKRMAHAFYGAPSKEISILGPFEFSCAGTREDESLIPVLFDEIVDCIEQNGNPLDFVNDVCGLVGVRSHDVRKFFRMRRQCAAHVGFKEIDRKRFGKLLSKPYRLSCAARPKKKETALGEAYCSLFHGAYNNIFAHRRQLQFSAANGKNAPIFPLAAENSKYSLERMVA